MKKVRFFNPGKEFTIHQKEYVDEYIKTRTSGDLILRGALESFETNMAKYLGVKHAIGVNSGTDALFISLKALGITTGDRVLVPSHTFVATAQVVNQLGAIPVLYDLGEIVGDTEGIKAIIPAHIAGKFDMNMIGHPIPVIEDACQALGAEYDGQKAGTFGATGCFSFYPAKILGSPGDAGMIVTNSDAIDSFARGYRNHCKGFNSLWGINSRLDNVWAAELDIKLGRIDELLDRRKEIAEMYLNGIGGRAELPTNEEGRVWQDFIIRTTRRDELFEYLKENGIETLKNEYPFPIEKKNCPKSISYEAETLRLPIDPVLTNEEINYIIKTINTFDVKYYV